MILALVPDFEEVFAVSVRWVEPFDGGSARIAAGPLLPASVV